MKTYRNPMFKVPNKSLEHAIQMVEDGFSRIKVIIGTMTELPKSKAKRLVKDVSDAQYEVSAVFDAIADELDM